MIGTIGMMGIISLAAGGAIGAVARYGVNLGALSVLGQNFPYGPMIVNIVGSFLMGLLVAKFAMMETSQELRLFAMTGFLGAFTTFSTFSLDVMTLWQRGDIVHAMLYMMASVILSILALGLALWLMKGSTL